MKKFLAFAVACFISTTAWAADNNSYRLQPGDQLDISIWNEDSMRRQVRVLPDGSISYPLVGHVSVAGMTPAEAEKLIKKRLVDGKFYNDPPLNVSVAETRGYQVFIVGRVRNPGVFTANRPLDVLQALSLAGGLDDFAGKRDIVVLRRNGNGQEVHRFNYNAVHSGKDVSSNIVLQVGDTLVVPEVGMF